MVMEANKVREKENTNTWTQTSGQLNGEMEPRDTQGLQWKTQTHKNYQ